MPVMPFHLAFPVSSLDKARALYGATMFFLDPCGNAIEFKAFENPAMLFAK